MKTEIANKKLEILNLIFKSKDGASWNEVSEMLNEFKKVCKDEAITEHEASQWKKYPENLPDWDKKYWALNIFGHESSCYGREFDAICVIAFRELPKPYQEGVGNPFRPTTDSNPKAFKP